MKSKVLAKILADKKFKAADSADFMDELLHDYVDHLENEDLKPKKKENHVGIEIECFADISRGEFQEILLEMDLEKFVQITDDSSIESDGGGDSMELRVLIPEKKLSVVLKKLGKALKEAGCAVNESCGLHVHLDMRNRNVDKCYDKLIKFQDVMYGLVESERWGNDFCMFTNEHSKGQRYSSINRTSYHKHKTIEVRLHHGTVDVDRIEKWVKLLIKMLGTRTAPVIESKAAVLKWVGPGKLRQYVKKNFNEQWFSQKKRVANGSYNEYDDMDGEEQDWF